MLFSRIVTALVGIVFVPIYVKMIGAESYGLVAFYGTLAGALVVLDLGLSTAISRQVAILKTRKGSEKEMNDLVFSVEIIYWIIAICVGLLIIALANLIAVYWVNAKDLPVHIIRNTVMLMGAVFAFQFPASIYSRGDDRPGETSPQCNHQSDMHRTKSCRSDPCLKIH